MGVEFSAALLEHLCHAEDRAALQWREPPYFVAEGAQSRVYRFAVGEEPPMALRVLGPKMTEEELRREVDLQSALYEVGFAVPAVHGSGGAEVGLGGPFAILEWVPGKPLFAWSPVILGWLLIWSFLGLPLIGVLPLIALWWTSSSMLRRLHDLPVEAVRARLPEPERYSVASELDEVEASIAADPVLARFAPVTDWLRARLPAEADTVVCHGDFWYGNVMVEPFRVTAVIDWSAGRLAPPEYDLAWSRIQHLSRMPLPFLRPGLWTELLWLALKPFGWMYFGGHRLAYRLVRGLDGELLDVLTVLQALKTRIWIHRHPENARDRWDAAHTRRQLERIMARALEQNGTTLVSEPRS